MKLNPIGANQSELLLNNGTVVLFSYKTPVAAFNLNPHDKGGFPICRTEKKWSRTTEKHINNWTKHSGADLKPQSFFDDLVK